MKPGKLANRPDGSRRLVIAAVVAGWLMAVIAPPAGLAWWRSGRLAELADPAVQAEWDTFRAAMRQESDRSGPVQRKVPKSAEPPELVWLRDYFWLAVAAWVVLGGTLGGFLAIIVLGVAGPGGATGPGSSGP